MKFLVMTLTLLLVAGLAGASRAADCYEGTWEAETKAAHKTLEIKDGECLKLTVIPKETGKAEVVYDTCYKLKGQQKQAYLLEIDDHGKFSSAEVTCSGEKVRLKWGKVANETYRPVKK